MQITEQDKRDIKETIKWLDAGCFHLMQLKVDMDDGQWLKNVEDATDTAEIWLNRIIEGE
tara:strand:- start:56 stop:235 length:180 start_codon:yes stop_codon:yes gene_type:complete